MKITETELNLAYEKVNELKRTFISEPEEIVEVDIERNPLTDTNFFEEDSEFVIPFKLSFKFDKEIGPKGSYILATKNVEVIMESED